MAIKKRRSTETAKDRQRMYMTRHIRKSTPKFDRHGGYREACVALAEETGCDPEAAWEEWLERAATRMYLGVVDVEDAEIEALRDIQERFRRAS